MRCSSSLRYAEHVVCNAHSNAHGSLAAMRVIHVSYVIFDKQIHFFFAPLLCLRPRRGGGGIRRSSVRPSVRPSVCLSVCLSDVAYIGSNSKTERPRKTKLCTGVPQVTCDFHTDFNVKRSKVKVTGRRHIVAAT